MASSSVNPNPDESSEKNQQHRSHYGIDPDLLVERGDQPDEPLFVGKGGSTHDATVDHSDGLVYSNYESPARTHFDLQDIEEFRERQDWERRRQWHEGNRNNWNGHKMERRQSAAEKLDAIDKKRIADALCSACCTNRGEKQIVIQNSTKLAHEAFGQHRGLPRVFLGLIAVVAETRRPMFGADFKQASMHRQEPFRRLMEQCVIDYTDLTTIKREVREQLPDYTLT